MSLAIILLAFFAVLLVCHWHGEPSGTSPSHCAMCAAIHNFAETPAVFVAVLLAGIAVLIEPREPHFTPQVGLAAFFIRPPPVVL